MKTSKLEKAQGLCRYTTSDKDPTFGYHGVTL